MLEKVKIALGITGNFLNETIQIYIDEVIEYLKDAGVSESLINESVGIVVRGVADLWNNGAGNANLSPYFYQRTVQLVYKSKEENNELQTEYDE